MGVTVVGLLVGLLVAAGSARLIRTLVFGVDTPDPISFVLGTAILAVVALLACVIPAWRASTLDPAIVLRSE